MKEDYLASYTNSLGAGHVEAHDEPDSIAEKNTGHAYETLLPRNVPQLHVQLHISDVQPLDAVVCPNRGRDAGVEIVELQGDHEHVTWDTDRAGRKETDHIFPDEASVGPSPAVRYKDNSHAQAAPKEGRIVSLRLSKKANKKHEANAHSVRLLKGRPSLKVSGSLLTGGPVKGGSPGLATVQTDTQETPKNLSLSTTTPGAQKRDTHRAFSCDSACPMAHSHAEMHQLRTQSHDSLHGHGGREDTKT